MPKMKKTIIAIFGLLTCVLLLLLFLNAIPGLELTLGNRYLTAYGDLKGLFTKATIQGVSSIVQWEFSSKADEKDVCVGKPYESRFTSRKIEIKKESKVFHEGKFIIFFNVTEDLYDLILASNNFVGKMELENCADELSECMCLVSTSKTCPRYSAYLSPMEVSNAMLSFNTTKEVWANLTNITLREFFCPIANDDEKTFYSSACTAVNYSYVVDEKSKYDIKPAKFLDCTPMKHYCECSSPDPCEGTTEDTCIPDYYCTWDGSECIQSTEACYLSRFQWKDFGSEQKPIAMISTRVRAPDIEMEYPETSCTIVITEGELGGGWFSSIGQVFLDKGCIFNNLKEGFFQGCPNKL